MIALLGWIVGIYLLVAILVGAAMVFLWALMGPDIILEEGVEYYEEFLFGIHKHAALWLGYFLWFMAESMVERR